MANQRNLTRYRKLKHWTIQELANRVGVTGATISRYETGERNMSIEMAKKIAEALDVKCWWKLYE